MTYKQWCELRNVLTELNDVVESKVCDVKVSEAFDDVWDLVDEIDTTQEDRWNFTRTITNTRRYPLHILQRLKTGMILKRSG